MDPKTYLQSMPRAARLFLRGGGLIFILIFLWVGCTPIEQIQDWRYSSYSKKAAKAESDGRSAEYEAASETALAIAEERGWTDRIVLMHHSLASHYLAKDNAASLEHYEKARITCLEKPDCSPDLLIGNYDWQLLSAIDIHRDLDRSVFLIEDAERNRSKFQSLDINFDDKLKIWLNRLAEVGYPIEAAELRARLLPAK